jgi:glucose-6-phosphate 1-dehydrogenase
VIKSGSVLAINCGSSSIKFSVIDHETGTHVIRGSIERIGQENAQLKYTAAHGIGSQSLGMIDHERALQSIEGDSTLFTRQDWVELAWSLIDPIIETWQISKPRDFPNYEVGSWGPKTADDFLQRDGRRWRQP